jgi:hypothetical protein
MAGGRPTDYSEEIIQKSKDYIASCEDELTSVISGQSDSFTKYEQKLKVKIPTIEGLALYLKITRTSLYLWEKEHVEFSYILEELRQKQADRLFSNGLSGDYNSTIAKVLLTKHGYTDKTEVDQKTTIKDERIDTDNLSEEDLRLAVELQRKSRVSKA